MDPDRSCQPPEHEIPCPKYDFIEWMRDDGWFETYDCDTCDHFIQPNNCELEAGR
jgi:hypothetical protein